MYNTIVYKIPLKMDIVSLNGNPGKRREKILDKNDKLITNWSLMTTINNIEMMIENKIVLIVEYQC